MWRAILVIGLVQLAAPDFAKGDDRPKPLKAPFTKEEAKAAREAWAKHLGKKVEEEIDIGGGLKMVFELIPPGTFMMGSSAQELKLKDENEPYENETPQHQVTITKPFYLGKFPVTQAEYMQLTGMVNPSYFSAGGCGRDKVASLDTNRFPVESLDWADAKECASALEKTMGSGWAAARLPSEAMWEYACRAGTETPWNVGNRLTEKDANFGNVLGRTRAVGRGTPNRFGLYDMHGNVWQWCFRAYEDYPSTAQTDPETNGNSAAGVLRGGSWYDSPRDCRSARRGRDNGPAAFLNDLGVRLALVPASHDK